MTSFSVIIVQSSTEIFKEFQLKSQAEEFVFQEMCKLWEVHDPVLPPDIIQASAVLAGRMSFAIVENQIGGIEASKQKPEQKFLFDAYYLSDKGHHCQYKFHIYAKDLLDAKAAAKQRICGNPACCFGFSLSVMPLNQIAA